MKKFSLIFSVIFLGTIIMMGCSEKQDTTSFTGDNIQLNQEHSPPVDTTCGQIGDFVWYDDNMNGIQDAGEGGVYNVEVGLYLCGATTPLAMVYTDANGYYLFDPVCESGDLAVKFELPAGYVFTVKDAGTDDAVDSDVMADGWTDCFYFDGAAGEINLTIDAGIYMPQTGGGCTYTMGYWKNHPNDWPVDTLMLGSVQYSQMELLQIFRRPVKGNGLVSLAHQLIAAKLNVENGADPTDVQGYIDDADAMIGSLVVPPIGGGYLAPSSTGYLTHMLDQYNMGYIGPGHCDDMQSVD